MICVGSVAQKGGVGKTSLAGFIGTLYQSVGWQVLLADMDVSQASLIEWSQRREYNRIAPSLAVKSFEQVNDVVASSEADKYDMVVFDGAPHASMATRDIAEISDIILLATGASIMDLNPQIKLAHELTTNGIDKSKILFILNRVGNSTTEYEEVLEYLRETNYKVVDGFIPEKTACRKAFREGKTFTEVPFKTLRSAAEQVAQAIINRIEELT